MTTSATSNYESWGYPRVRLEVSHPKWLRNWEDPVAADLQSGAVADGGDHCHHRRPHHLHFVLNFYAFDTA